MGRRGYPPEFRRKVLDLVEAGRNVTDVARAAGEKTAALLSENDTDPAQPARLLSFQR